jgi:hypothetical protein
MEARYSVMRLNAQPQGNSERASQISKLYRAAGAATVVLSSKDIPTGYVTRLEMYRWADATDPVRASTAKPEKVITLNETSETSPNKE